MYVLTQIKMFRVFIWKFTYLMPVDCVCSRYFINSMIHNPPKDKMHSSMLILDMLLSNRGDIDQRQICNETITISQQLLSYRNHMKQALNLFAIPSINRTEYLSSVEAVHCLMDQLDPSSISSTDNLSCKISESYLNNIFSYYYLTKQTGVHEITGWQFSKF